MRIMVTVKPFEAIRPPKNIVTEVAAPPYDVLNSAEAKAMAGEKSLLHITKPEIDFDPIAGEHEQRTYDKAVENFKLWKERGWPTMINDDFLIDYIISVVDDPKASNDVTESKRQAVKIFDSSKNYESICNSELKRILETAK